MTLCCIQCGRFEPKGHLSGYCNLYHKLIKDGTDPKSACSLGVKDKESIDVSKIIELNVNLIKPSNITMRKIDGKILSDLMLSIKEHGLLQPIMVREINQKYEIVWTRTCMREVLAFIDKLMEERKNVSA